KRKELGADINYLQKKIISSIDLKRKELLIGHSEKTMKIEAETLGFDLPKIGHLHPITQTIRMLNQIFIEMGYSIVDGPEIETDEYNFRRMNVPFDHPARDVQDT
ncbi:MAG: phenylalanine--tRNA ligase subunit alpha, partial [Parcubacteria group bacterium CG10_big_fil_rev_8_21_14_0_10_35_15]